MKIYPVVHINEIETAVDQGALAQELGADGVFLIDHLSLSIAPTLSALQQLKNESPNNFVGINFLGLKIDETYRLLDRLSRKNPEFSLPDAVWADNARASRTRLVDIREDFSNLSMVPLLGGIAFKYTPGFTEDPILAARQVSELQDRVDVITTSGAGTGKSPTKEKLAAMKNVAKKPIAVASGIDSSNIEQFSGLVDIILVASSVETEPYSGIFDTRKLKEIIDHAHRL